ncbi:hypothetical protein CSHISOI_09782 [Colletotrichum shisoi]|uniref:Uncharacterized protein n=1 Tax=Colletotrichum shisoi TaxID=2078593 RepID=A0A5Q4BFZ9_9PEZI|nr:hypothetical protein CSHISOI_09782 [Colletotrichum shisoi]
MRGVVWDDVYCRGVVCEWVHYGYIIWRQTIAGYGYNEGKDESSRTNELNFNKGRGKANVAMLSDATHGVLHNLEKPPDRRHHGMRSSSWEPKKGRDAMAEKTTMP